MNLQTFLSNFGHVANAPDGVKTLRQLVMASALSGKFSAPNEDLPSDIQTRLEEARSLHFHSSGKREKPLLFGAPLIQEFEIPAGWQWVRVGQICDLQTGATPSTQRPEYWGGEIPWLASGDVSRREIFECEGRITEEGLANSNCKVLPKNSVLIALNGQGKTRATVALLRIPAACNQSLVAMIPFDLQIVTPEYLILSLRYRYYEIRDITGQDQRRGLNMGLVSDLSVPLAPLAEQKRIVAKVDELMVLCDQLEAQQQERERRFPVLSRTCHARFVEAPTTANLIRIFDETGTISPADLRKTILTLAVKGAIVPQLSRYKSAKASFPGLAPLDPKSRKRIDMPHSWECCSYLSLTSLVTSGSRGWKEFYSSTGAIFLRTQNIKTDKLVLDDVAFVQLPKSTEGMRAQVLKDDIMITITGANVTKAARVEERIPEAYVSQHIALTRPRWPEMSRWLHLCFISPGSARGSLEKLAYGDKPGLNLSNIRELILPVPPLDEQRRIVDKVDALMALVDDLEAQQQERDKVAEAFARAGVATFIGTSQLGRPDKMKAPKTKLVSVVTLGKTLKPNANAPLARLLGQHKGTLSAKALWQQSGLTIDVFYQKLKTEIAQGWIARPAEAEMQVLEEG